MGTIIPLIIILFAAGGIVYIITKKARALAQDEGGGLVYPEFADKQEPAENARTKRDYSDFFKIFNIKKEETFIAFMEKFTRRMRVRLMRIENWLASLANRLQERGRQKREGAKRPAPSDEGGGDGASFISFSAQAQAGESDEQYWLSIVKQDSQSPYPYKKLGEIYTAREDFHEARSVLKHAFRLDPSDKEIQTKIEELRGKRTRKK